MKRENGKGQSKHFIWQSVTYKIEQQCGDEQATAADKSATCGRNNHFSSNVFTATPVPDFYVNLQTQS